MNPFCSIGLEASQDHQHKMVDVGEWKGKELKVTLYETDISLTLWKKLSSINLL